jgi:hypothetical protein
MIQFPFLDRQPTQQGADRPKLFGAGMVSAHDIASTPVSVVLRLVEPATAKQHPIASCVESYVM